MSFKLTVAFTVLLLVSSLFVFTNGNTKTYALHEGRQWVKCCSSGYQHKLICPDATAKCRYTIITTSEKDKFTQRSITKIDSQIECLDEEENPLKYNRFTSITPCNPCEKNSTYRGTGNVSHTWIRTLTLEDI
ncbi:uncharacterized protein LOC115879924 [Sitophilus oryzae]|uniref:Uncharacterized protein LOC115879924 n=1 Tax=Sitophilus oryzae TaxID=7048 RepID=A0A6J2XQA4_SITOR|nr:uncharacterized protein LOC115879924 [Sitophilus oryzae]